MSKYKIKAVLDDQTKSVEYNRGYTPQLNDLKDKLEKKFGGAVGMRFKYADGRTQALYQDFHLADALKDCEKNGVRTLVLQLTREGPSISSSPARTQSSTTLKPSYTAPTSNTPTRSDPPAPSHRLSQSGSKFCEMCGSPITASAKFCSSCGHSGSAPAPSPSSSSSSSSGPICAGCKNPITSAAVKALDKVWHKDCFSCKGCNRSLMDTSFASGENGAPYCSKCYDEQFGVKCGRCGSAISGQYLSIGGKEYHKECFVCENCGNQFDSGYFMKDGKQHCKNCL